MANPKNPVSQGWSEDECLHIQLQAELMFASTHLESEPLVVDSDVTAYEQFEKYFSTSSSATISGAREKVKGNSRELPAFIDRRDRLVGGVTRRTWRTMKARQHTQRPKIWTIDITSTMLSQYRDFRSVIGFKTHVTHPEEEPELWAFLFKEASRQYRAQAPIIPTHGQQALNKPRSVLHAKTIELTTLKHTPEHVELLRSRIGTGLPVEHAIADNTTVPPAMISAPYNPVSIDGTEYGSRNTNKRSHRRLSTVFEIQEEHARKRRRTTEPAKQKAPAENLIVQEEESEATIAAADQEIGIVQSPTATTRPFRMQSGNIQRKLWNDQATQREGEKFGQDPKEPTRMIARYGHGLRNIVGIIEQIDSIPKRLEVAGYVRTDESETYVLPAEKDMAVPKLTGGKKGKSNSSWIPPPDGKGKWSLDGEGWAPTLIIRRFDAKTHEYLSSHLVLPTALNDYQLEDNTWLNRYNKAWKQILSRVDGFESKNERTLWTSSELQALYSSINKWCKTNGVDRFSHEAIKEDLATLTQDVNNACIELHTKRGKARKKDMVASRIKNSIGSPSDAFRTNPLKLLAARALKMKEDIKQGKEISKAAQYPHEAIPMNEIKMSETGPGEEDGEDMEDDKGAIEDNGDAMEDAGEDMDEEGEVMEDEEVALENLMENVEMTD